MYGIRPRNSDEPVIEPMKAYVSEIDKVGKVTIKYSPPEAVVPDQWQQIFDPEERNKLPDAERKAIEAKIPQYFDVRFRKNSDETDQDYFSF